MAQREVVTLNETTPQLEVPQVGDTYLMPRDVEVSGSVTATSFSGDGSALTGISASPAGADTQVQFNDGGAFAGDTGFTFNKTNKALTLGGATVTASAPVLDLSQTWNAAAVFNAFDINITDTSSTGASLGVTGSTFGLFRISGTTKIAFTKAGAVEVSNGSATSPGLRFLGANGGTGFYSLGGANVAYAANGSAQWRVTNTDFQMNSTYGLGWESGAVGSGNNDVALYRDAAATLALRNGTNAQTFRIYNTYTDSSNYERGVIKWNSNTLDICVEGAGTGNVGRNLRIYTNTANSDVKIWGYGGGYGVSLGNNGTAGFYVTNASARVGSGYHIGFSSASNPEAANADLTLYRDAANTLALRNSTTAQTFRVYETYTDGSNHAYGYLNASTSGFDIGTTAAGTGTKRPVRILGQSLASAEAVSILELSQTWNTTGTPTAIKLNVTDTASNAASLLMDLQVGGVSRFKIDKYGAMTCTGDSSTTTTRHNFYSVDTYTQMNVGVDTSNSVSLEWDNSAKIAQLTTASFNFPIQIRGTYFSIGTTTDDVRLFRDAAATLALRNSTNAQTFNIYNTYTDSSNYERGFVRWNSNVLEIGAEKAGTGTQRSVKITVPASGGHLYLQSYTGGPVYIGTAPAANYTFVSETQIRWNRNQNFSINTTDLQSDQVPAIFTITGSGAYPSASTNLTGGSIYFVGGVGASGSAGNAHGGNIYLRGGQGYGTGTHGAVIIGDSNTSAVSIGQSTTTVPLYIYNTYTDASNYERGFLKWNSNVLEIGTESAGTGTSRSVKIYGVDNLREKLTATRTYYVRTDGSDSNDGLTDSSGGAFLTVQKAIDTVMSIDNGGYDVTIQVGDGTYSGACSITSSFIGSGTVTIQGNSSTPTNVVFSTGSSDVLTVDGGATLVVKDLKVTNTGSFGLRARHASYLKFSGIDFGAIGAHQIRVDGTGIIEAIGNYTISGAAATHMTASGQGFIRIQSRTVTISGTPAFSAFAAAEYVGAMVVNGNTYSGSATGSRYSALGNGVIYTAGGGASYFPGNSVGTTSSGGQYL